MIKIRELLKVELMKKMTLLGEHIFYDNEIDSIGILDYEALENQYSLFRKGDIVLTTLMFAKDDEKMAEEALIRLMKQRVSAIAIKNIYYHRVTDKVQDYADKHKVQLMVFDDIAFEDIIVAVSDEIRNKEIIKYYEIRIDQLITTERSKKFVLKTLNEINSSFLDHSKCSYCVPMAKDKKKTSKLLANIMKNVRSRKSKGMNSIHNAIFRYRQGIFIIHTFNSLLHPMGYLEEIYSNVGLDKNAFYIGTSELKKELNQLAYGIHEAIASNVYCQNKKKQQSYFHELGIHKLLLPLGDNHWTQSFSHQIIHALKEHDTSSSFKLLPTAQVYIENRGELKKTADALEQHVNTIRYRLGKIKEVIGYHEDNHDFYEQLFLAVLMYQNETN